MRPAHLTSSQLIIINKRGVTRSGLSPSARLSRASLDPRGGRRHARLPRCRVACHGWHSCPAMQDRKSLQDASTRISRLPTLSRVTSQPPIEKGNGRHVSLGAFCQPIFACARQRQGVKWITLRCDTHTHTRTPQTGTPTVSPVSPSVCRLRRAGCQHCKVTGAWPRSGTALFPRRGEFSTTGKAGRNEGDPARPGR
jgi:hypothetical protein